MKTMRYVTAIVMAQLFSCTYDEIKTVNCETPPVLTVQSVVDTECNKNEGVIRVAGAAGTGALTYSIDGENFTASTTFEGLLAGQYEIVVRDENMCTSSIIAEVKNSNGLNISLSATPSGCGSSNGTIEVLAQNGVEPYRFILNGETEQSSNVFSGLSPNSYTVKAIDASGCEITQDVQVVSGKEFDEIKSLIATNCALSTCHGGNVSPDFRNEQNILNNANKIAARTANKSMPPGNALPQEQIQSIACWVKDGAKTN